VSLTQSQLVSAPAERAELSKIDAKRALAALDEIVLEELGNAEKGADRGTATADRSGEAGAEGVQRPTPATGEGVCRVGGRRRAPHGCASPTGAGFLPPPYQPYVGFSPIRLEASASQWRRSPT
jgi:DNA-binding protein HU-beta